MDSVLRPRDIQARIRAGQTPETVAAAAQTSVDRIMGFATPVLAERAYVAQQAQKASVRRRAGNGPVGQLGDAVAGRLVEDGADPAAVEWDAWRREDGKWVLVADYMLGDGQHRATFVFDQAGRYVVADDDEARRLVGERAAAATQEEQLGLGDDAIEVVTGRRPEPLPRDEEPTVDLGPVADAVRPEPRPEPPSEPEPERQPETLFEAPEPEPRRADRPSRSKGRASVPSWDEIMFGSQRGTD